MIDGITMKGKRKILFQLQKQILWQLHNNEMEIEKMRLLACESVYWVNINADIKGTMAQHTTCQCYQQTQPHEKKILYDLPCKQW